MIQTLALPATWKIVERSDRAVTAFVERVLALTEPNRCNERRKDVRRAFPHLLTLTPISDATLKIIGDPVTVAGKYLAGRGIDFYHSEPLPFRHAVVSFEESLHLDAHFILDITWCRFLRPGWYDSGGRFTHIVTPLGSDALKTCGT